MDFDFSKIQAKKSEPGKIPGISRPKTPKPNPLAAEYDKSLAAKDANGFGEWVHLVLPGKTETVVGADGKKKITYGLIVKEATALIRRAADAKKMGVSFRHQDDGKGNITLHFQAKPRRGGSA